jgi:flagellar basal body-associated protein FliL
MAEPQATQDNKQGAEQESQTRKGKGSKLMACLVPVLAIILCAAGGFAVGRIFGTRGQAQNLSAAGIAGETLPVLGPIRTGGTGPSWYYELEPVVANLNEPGVTRYVRVTLTLEIGSNLSEREGIPFLEQRKPLMKNLLTLFIANLTLEDIRGERNLRQVQTQIADALNQGLFPNAQPCIQRILFKELSIQ